MTPAILIDLLLSVLLAATLVYGVILNRRLTQLRSDRDQLATVITGLDQATSRAVESMAGLKQAADTKGRSLHETIERARSMREDLNFLVERGEKAAARLEALTRPEIMRSVPPLRQGTPRDTADGVPMMASSAPPRPETPPRNEGRHELLKVLEGMR